MAAAGAGIKPEYTQFFVYLITMGLVYAEIELINGDDLALVRRNKKDESECVSGYRVVYASH